MVNLVLALATCATVSLDGEWSLSYFPQPETAVRTVPLTCAYKTVKAKVPGNCELDLVRAGVIPDPLYSTNGLALFPYERYQWLYAREFIAPEHGPTERVILHLDGVDTLADVFVNRKLVGSTDSMLVPHEFDVTRHLRFGGTNNLLQVLIRSPRAEHERWTRDWHSLRKAAHMGGWDILPRAYAAGLWRSVSLEVRPATRILATEWCVREVDPAKRRARVLVSAEACGRYEELGGRWRFTLSRDGRIAATKERPLASWRSGDIVWDLVDVDPWWPRAMGDPVLYNLKTELVGTDGRVLAVRDETVGVRTIRLVRENVNRDSAKGKGQFLFVVNGEPCYVRGTNWVPVDALHGRDGELMGPVLEMLADLNCNMVRVWGGGVYEPAAFWDWCDAHGIMVWQDFCDYSIWETGNELARTAVGREVEWVVRAFRNRASLALWCGNNELDLAFWRWKRIGGKPTDPNVHDVFSREVIPNAIFANDRAHDYLPSSPYLGPDVIADEASESERHVWGRKHYKSDDYVKTRAWFMSETGFHGCPNLDSLKRMMQPSCVYPWTEIPGGKQDRTWNLDWQLKAVNASLDASKKGAWDRNNVMVRQVEYVFGTASTNLEDFVWQSQFAQAEGLKYITELFRSRKFDRFNGLLWWNLRDGWPVVSDAVVDYWNGKKMAYGFLKTVQRDAVVLVTDDGTVWAVNDRRVPVKGRVAIRDVATGKTVLSVPSFTIPANGKISLGKAAFEGQGLLVIGATLAGEPYDSHYLYGKEPFDYTQVRKWFCESHLLN